MTMSKPVCLEESKEGKVKHTRTHTHTNPLWVLWWRLSYTFITHRGGKWPSLTLRRPHSLQPEWLVKGGHRPPWPTSTTRVPVRELGMDFSRGRSLVLCQCAWQGWWHPGPVKDRLLIPWREFVCNWKTVTPRREELGGRERALAVCMDTLSWLFSYANQ